MLSVLLNLLSRLRIIVIRTTIIGLVFGVVFMAGVLFQEPVSNAYMDVKSRFVPPAKYTKEALSEVKRLEQCLADSEFLQDRPDMHDEYRSDRCKSYKVDKDGNVVSYYIIPSWNELYGKHKKDKPISNLGSVVKPMEAIASRGK